MRIDAHHHLWDLVVRDQPWTRDVPALRRTFAADDLRPALERHAIEASIVVQTLATPDETPELLALAAEDRHVRAVVGWTDLTAPGVVDRLAELREQPGGARLAGIRYGVQDEPDPDWLNRPDVRRGIAAVGAAGLVYELLVRPDQLPGAVRIVRDLPDVTFVLDHAGNPVVGDGPLREWSRLLDDLAGCPNVAVKLSGLVTRVRPGHDPVDALRAHGDVLLTTVGPHRLIYGSDWPVCLLAADYDETLGVAEALTDQLSVSEREAVFGASAERWYGFEPPTCMGVSGRGRVGRS